MEVFSLPSTTNSAIKVPYFIKPKMPKTVICAIIFMYNQERKKCCQLSYNTWSIVRYIPIPETLKCGGNVHNNEKYSTIHIFWPGFENLHIYRNMSCVNLGTIIPETTCSEINWEAYQIHITGPHFGSADLESSAADSRNLYFW